MSLATMMRIITKDTAENEETDEATNTEDFRQTGVTGAARSGQGCETGNDQDRDHGGGQGVKRTNIKATKLQQRVNLKKNDVIIHNGQICNVGDRLGKRGIVGREGKYYNFFNLFQWSGAKPYYLDLSKVTYQKLDNNQQVKQVLVLAGKECHMDLVPFRLHGNQECMEAKRQELKIVKDHKVVPDNGHYVISSRFIIGYKKQ